ncbi:MAG: glycosyltransferase family 39 protein [Caldilinea sp.]|nr:glycosyltransferase family 39 protein [Caldilinea sp.]
MQQNGASLSSAHRTGAVIGQRSLLLAGILLGFALRLHRLGAESLWYDETVSVHLARKSIADMIAHTAGDIHPPGYYLLLHLWGRLTTPTLAHGLEFLYAWPSLFAGVLLLALIYALGRRLFDAPTALLGVWLAAVSPFQLWYSQEVRMYTVGAVLALLCLWAALRFVDRLNPLRWLLVFALSAAAGMYTLYYFAFWLVGVNVIVLGLLWRNAERSKRIVTWLGAQLGALLLFAPWLPTFIRQAIDPPVPPWRAPWDSASALLASLAETLAAFLVGQSPPAHTNWPWALLMAAVIAVVLAAMLFTVQQERPDAAKHLSGVIITIAVVFLPVLQLYLLTAFVTPVYHVRYVFLYAPLFVLVPALGMRLAWHWRRLAAVGALAIWLAISATAAVSFWYDPLYRADDHRSAVASLAAQWRPGDAILVNAGWIYPILTTYWPTQPAGVDGVAPPPIAQIVRLPDFLQDHAADRSFFTSPTIVRGGSVDGAPSLGWGAATSDFFAITASDAIDALAALAETSQRLWHYRLYDTVSDPDGMLRRWLDDHMTLLSESPVPGRDFGLVQLFAPQRSSDQSALSALVCFGEQICLLGDTQNATVSAGSPLYLPLRWRASTPLPDLAVSLRLYDRGGRLVAQTDAPFLPRSSDWPLDTVQFQPFALPVGVSTKPGNYTLELVVYRSEDGRALPLPDGEQTVDGQRLRLGEVTVTPPVQAPVLPAALASFDYIDLIEARLDRTAAQPGEIVRAALVWRPRPGDYRDDYQAVLTLRDGSGAAAQEWRFPLGGHDYPSGGWLATLPVRDFYDLPISATLPSGQYTLTVALHRTADDLSIASRRGWLSVRQVEIGAIQLEPGRTSS